jgi:hypothetical protein
MQYISDNSSQNGSTGVAPCYLSARLAVRGAAAAATRSTLEWRADPSRESRRASCETMSHTLANLILSWTLSKGSRGMAFEPQRSVERRAAPPGVRSQAPILTTTVATLLTQLARITEEGGRNSTRRERVDRIAQTKQTEAINKRGKAPKTCTPPKHKITSHTRHPTQPTGEEGG